MSSATRGKQAVRGRGFARGSSQARGSSTRRSRADHTGSRGASPRGDHGGKTRSRSGSRGGKPKQNTGFPPAHTFGTDYQARYTALEAHRKQERANAIRRGLIADPDKPRSLADAITLVGTCQDMCAEFERVERIVQKDVWKEETDPTNRISDREPDEARMVKKFRRAAAGIEEQLPSDLRPPRVLQATCKYLFEEVITDAASLGKVHHFVWDRTRAIRNDFSIQQITKPDDLRIAIDCYENIARFHIVSLHQLAVPQKPYDKYDWQQEREQLDRTLLSLMQYYEDSRGRIALPNEAEFRSYSVVFQLQDPLPDVEDRVQSWPREIALHPRVRQALQLYASACTSHDLQGPLKPGAQHTAAQQDWHRFWRLVESRGVPYLMACVAEIYFNHVRKTTLQALIEASGSKMTAQWTIEEVRDMLAFDSEDEVEEFCERFTVGFKQVGDRYLLDLAGWKGRSLPDAKATASKQTRSQLVEQKRYSRTLPAIIVGLTIQQARSRGMMEDDEGDISMSGNEEMSDQESLFVSQPQQSNFLDATAAPFKPAPVQSSGSPFAATNIASEKKVDLGNSIFGPTASSGTFKGFGPPTTANTAPSTFGKPSDGVPRAVNPFAPKPVSATPAPTGFQFGKPTASASSDSALGKPSAPSKPGFNFLQGGTPFGDTPKLGGATESNKPSAIGETTSEAESGSGNSTSAEGGKKDGGSFQSLFSSKLPATDATQSGQRASSNVPFDASQMPQQDSTSAAPPAKLPVFDFMSGAKPIAELSTGPSPFAPSVLPVTSKSATPTFTFAEPAVKPLKDFFPTQPSEQKPTLPSVTPAKQDVAAASQATEKPLFGFLSPAKASHPPSSSTTKDGNNNTQLSSLPTSQAIHPTPNTKPLDTTKSQPPPIRLDDVVQRLASELTLDSKTGFLQQYIDFVVGQIVTEAQEKVYHEKLEEEAKDFRAYKLSVRFALFWRAVCRRRRLARNGRGLRQRAKERLHELRSQGSQASSVAGSQTHTSKPREPSRQEKVDTMFQQSVRAGRWKLPTANVDGEEGTNTAGSKTVSRVDNGGRVVKPASSTESLRRSLNGGFAATPVRNTTRSSYFRRKALGLDVREDSMSCGGRKRTHSEVSADSPASLRDSSVTSSPLAATPDRYQSSVDSAAVNKLQKMDFEDDALLARLRAARETLQSSTAFLQHERTKPDSPPVMGPPAFPYQSPSLDHARSEARRRQQLALGSADVPAYRLRESRFVSRESYGQAIENARQIRESRSRANSRPASQTSQHVDMHMSNGYSSSAPSASPQLQASVDDDFTQTLSGVPIMRPESLGADGIVHSAYGSFEDSARASRGASQEAVLQHDKPLVAKVMSDIAQDFYQHPHALDTSHDFTIPPSQISQSLSASFRSTNAVDGTPVVGSPDLGYSAPSETHASAQEPADTINGQHSHANPFAALQNASDAGDAEGVEDEEDPEMYEDVQDDDESHLANGHDSYDEGQYDEEEDGDIDEDDEEEEDDEDDEDESEDEEDDAQGLAANAYYARAQAASQPSVNEALAAIGNNESDAIELSD